MAETTQRRSRFLYGWLVILPAATLVSWVNLTLYFVGLGPSVIPLQQEFGWSRTFISGAYSAAGIPGFFSPIFGYCIDRWGPRKMMFIGAFFSSGGALILSFSDGSGILWYVGWIIMMGPTGVWSHYPATQKVVTTWFYRQRGLAVGLQALSGAFSYIMASVHAWLIGLYGWRVNWRILSVVSFVSYMVIILGMIRDNPEERGTHADGVPMTPEERAEWAGRRQRQAGAAAPRRPAGPAGEVQFSIWQTLRVPAFWILCLAAFGVGAALQVQTTQQVPFLVGTMGIDPVVAGAVLGAMGIAGSPGRVASGWLVDRFGRGSARYFYALAVLLELLGMIILTQANSVVLVWAFAIVFGLGQGMTVTAPIIMIANYFGAGSYATVYASRAAVARIATVVAPTWAAWVFDTAGSYIMAFWVVIVILAVMMIVIVFAAPPKAPSTPAATRAAA